ncbi:MAG: hypothetical protein ACE5J7_00655 [Candidatus Aenigmatarchaeota archaeon]
MFSKKRLDDIRWLEIRMREAEPRINRALASMPRKRKLTAQDLGNVSSYIGWDAKRKQYYMLSKDEQEDFEREVYANFPT